MNLEPKDFLCWRRTLSTTRSILLEVTCSWNMNWLEIGHGVGESRD